MPRVDLFCSQVQTSYVMLANKFVHTVNREVLHSVLYTSAKRGRIRYIFFVVLFKSKVSTGRMFFGGSIEGHPLVHTLCLVHSGRIVISQCFNVRMRTLYSL